MDNQRGELKFRVIHEGEVIENHHIMNNSVMAKVFIKVVFNKFENEETPLSDFEKSFIWEEFTGGTDSNGVDIYHNDIYTMGDKNIKYQVVWHDSGFIGKQLGSSSYAGLSHWHNKITVIGNIHETPELLL